MSTGAVRDGVELAAPSAGGPPLQLDEIDQVVAHLEIRPDDAHAWYDLGCSYSRLGRYTEAAHALECASIFNPRSLGVQCELAYALCGCGEVEYAATLLESVISQDPGNGQAYLHLGLARFAANAVEEAARLWECAARLLEDPSDTLENLAMAYRRLGRNEEEARCWRRLQTFAERHPSIRHMLAAHGERPLPNRADDAYLRHLFDRFAIDFDAVLQVLQYRVPTLLESYLHDFMGAPSARLDILDAGCGTGLCGQRLRPWARRLTGVDISTGMLAQAHGRALYDELLESELTGCLESGTRRFDLIVAGDVFCYFGDLSPVLSTISHALTPGGRVFLTLEKDTEVQDRSQPGYRLQSHGRFCHDQDYVAQQLATDGFEVERLTTEILRQEAGELVEGLVIGLRKRQG